MSPQYISSLSFIKSLAQRRDIAFKYLTHAEIEMAKDGITQPDVQNALENCFSVQEQTHPGGTRYLVKGKDTDDRTITVVIEIEEEIVTIVIVTGWK